MRKARCPRLFQESLTQFAPLAAGRAEGPRPSLIQPEARGTTSQTRTSRALFNPETALAPVAGRAGPWYLYSVTSIRAATEASGAEAVVSDDPTFLKAILAAPEDDALRLVYADWLQENGQPERAEFIRAECEQATIHSDPTVGPNRWDNPRFWELQERVSELYDRHAATWFAELFKAHRGEVSTHRGFPHHIALTARKFIDHGDALFRAAPTIEDVYIGRLGRNMRDLARTAALGHVRNLTFFETPVREAEARHLAASPYLGNLRELHIGFTDTHIGPAGAIALARAKSIRQLQKLDIGDHAIYDAGASAILTSERLATLTDIHLGNNGLSDGILNTLRDAHHLKLKALDLMSNWLTGSGLAGLGAAHLAGLERLSLQRNPIGPTGAGHLASAPFVANLRELALANCNLDDPALAIVLGAAWPQLTELYVGWNALFGSRAAAALAANRSLARLEELSLGRCAIGPTQAKILGRASLPALRNLNADNNPLGPEGLGALLAGPLVCPVRTLHLTETELGDDGAEVLARSSAVANVRSLWLRQNRITNRGALALAESPHLADVQYLRVPENKIGKKGREALTRRFGKRVDLGD
jgi:uncharacterized protein (TIGR02996 family)